VGGPRCGSSFAKNASAKINEALPEGKRLPDPLFMKNLPEKFTAKVQKVHQTSSELKHVDRSPNNFTIIGPKIWDLWQQRVCKFRLFAIGSLAS
jgi:hypothetical protein